MKILLTGCAGFIGYHLTSKLIAKNHKVVGIDSLNQYYDPKLKKYRLSKLKKNKNFVFIKDSLKNKNKLIKILKKHKIDKVVHLAAQPGVRYSLINPRSYIDNNLLSFFNIMEASKEYKVKHFIYASSSSVYGLNKTTKFKEIEKTEKPAQLYAATKKSNELMVEAYSNLFKLKSTGLRFFSVYGPAGRPDMAIYLFTNKIYNNKKIDVFNYGNHARDFTYIDDVVDAVYKIISKNTKKSSLHEIYNIASGKSEKLSKLISTIEDRLGKIAKKRYLPIQKGDIIATSANIKKIKNDYNYKPKINIELGLTLFVKWFSNYIKKVKK
jgi:UDP-glucuronate 4-epimerase